MDKQSTPSLVWIYEMSVTHLELGLSARKSLLSRFSYLWTCWPICTHFLVLHISESRLYFFMIRSTVLGFLWSPCFPTIATFYDTHRFAYIELVELGEALPALIFYPWPDPLPVNRRKSRSSWFSIRSRFSSAASF